MSIQAVAWVLDESEAEGIDRLVLISIANHTDERGISRPSVRKIAGEARISTNTVMAAVKRLVALGELEIAIPGTRTTATRYRMTKRTNPTEGVADLRHPDGDEVSQHDRDTGVAIVSQSCLNQVETEPVPITTSPNPSELGDGHHGQHPSCRACGTNPRAQRTDAPPSPQRPEWQPTVVDDALAPSANAAAAADIRRRLDPLGASP
jgi:hypothetical protein